MASSIYSDYESWEVSGREFRSVIARMQELGRDLARTDRERAWVENLSGVEERFGSTPDIHVEELFGTPEESSFWVTVLETYAQAIYERRIGDQSDQTWQIWRIWAILQLARVLDAEARRRTAPVSGAAEAEICREVLWKRRYEAARRVRLALAELQEVDREFLPPGPDSGSEQQQEG